MVVDEEKEQLIEDVKRLKKMIEIKDGMIEEMEMEITKEKQGPAVDTKAIERAKELQTKLLDSQLECDSKMILLNEKEALIAELQQEVSRLEMSNRELANRSVIGSDNDETSGSFLEAEMLRITDELEKFKADCHTLTENNIDLQKQVITLKDEQESAIDNVKHLEQQMKEGRDEISRLEGEMFDLKNGTGAHAARGNSIFAEAMEAEQKLESDLRKLYAEKMALARMVTRLTEEKEDAEQRCRNAQYRGCAVRSAMSDIDVIEMNRLRKKVQELETERVHLWQRFLIEMKKVSKKELGGLITGYFESFKVSMASVVYAQDETIRKNDELTAENRRLNTEVNKLKQVIEELKMDKEGLVRKMNMQSRLATVDQTVPQSETNAKSSIFQSAVVKNKNLNQTGVLGVQQSMNSMSVTPQKPSPGLFSTSTAKKEEVLPKFAQKRLDAKKKEKENAENQQYNFVNIINVSQRPLFKPPTLNVNPTPEKCEENTK